MNLKKLFLIILLLSFASFTMAQNYALIVNKSNPINKISLEILEKIFLGKKIHWPNGKKIKVLVLKDGSIHKDFLKDTVKKSPMKFSMHWKKIIFTGIGSPLKTCNTEQEVIDFVLANETAIGYISKKSLNDSVKSVPVYKTLNVFKDKW
jgi:ABC-type phosphate transport system substrate-binding protein